MKIAYSPIVLSPSRVDIPITKCTEIQPRVDLQTWSDVKKGIREKVYSRVSGFENQNIIQKSDLLYNFKQENKPIRQSHSHLKNQIDSRFPKQESPIKIGLSRALYSPSQKYSLPLDDLKSSKAQPSAFLSEKDRFKPNGPSKSEGIDFTKRTKPITERVTLTDIIRISNHLNEMQPYDTAQLSNGYLQELVGLNQNINKILKNTNKYK